MYQVTDANFNTSWNYWEHLIYFGHWPLDVKSNSSETLNAAGGLPGFQRSIYCCVYTLRSLLFKGFNFDLCIEYYHFVTAVTVRIMLLINHRHLSTDPERPRSLCIWAGILSITSLLLWFTACIWVIRTLQHWAEMVPTNTESEDKAQRHIRLWYLVIYPHWAFVKTFRRSSKYIRPPSRGEKQNTRGGGIGWLSKTHFCLRVCSRKPCNSFTMWYYCCAKLLPYRY